MSKFMLLLLISGILTACGQVSLKVDIDTEPETTEVTQEDTSLTLIPEGCMTWFDGCNECMVQDQKIMGCTKKACAVMEKPECRVMVETTNDVPWETLEVTVGPERVDCVGVAPMKCLVVDGEYFYDDIADFEHESGFQYRLKIERYTQNAADVPADGSVYSYQLVEVLEKTKTE